MNKKPKQPPAPKLEAGSDIVLKWMVEKGMPLTKGVYLELAYMGDPPPDELPDDIQEALAKLPD
jgi:hypothetical protein